MKRSHLLACIAAIALCASATHAQWSANGSKIYYASGKVGIGTMNPNSPLQVVSNIGSADRPTLLVKMTNEDPDSYSAAIRGTNRGIGVNGIGVWGSHDGGGYGVYGTTVDDGIGVFGLSGAGGTGVRGSTSGDGTGVYGRNVSIVGTGVGVTGAANSAAGFDFYAVGAGTDYGSASSRRWKRDIRNIDNPLAKLAQLRGVYYTWDRAHGNKHDVGMIAEEVGEVLPEIVVYEANGVDAIGMDYAKLTPLLVEAVNALRLEKDIELDTLRMEKDQQIIELKDENAELRDELAQLRADVEALKAAAAK